MESNPVSESGVRMNKLLSDWMTKSRDFAESVLKRLFLMNPFRIENHEPCLSGQGILEETQLDPTQQGRSTIPSGNHHAMVTGVSCSSHVMAVAGALDWGRSETALGSMLNWAEDLGKAATTGNTSVLPITDSVLNRPTMPFASMLSPGGQVSQRERTVSFRSSWKYCGKFSVCRKCNRIMVTFPSGHIKIYRNVDLKCQALLPCYNQKSKVYQVECTCSEIIAAYEDGSICSWDLKNGELKGRIWVRGSGGPDDLPFRIKYKDRKLVVATKEGTIQTWQYISPNFTRLGCWQVTGTLVSRIEFDLCYVLLQDIYSFSVNVYFPTGQFVRMIQSNSAAMAYQNGKLITGDEDQVLNIWDVGTGVFLCKLEGHNESIDSVEIIQKNIVMIGSYSSGVFTVWDLAKILESSSGGDDGDEENSAFAAAETPSKRLVVAKNDFQHPVFRVGRNFIVGRIKGGLRIIDFPCRKS